MKVSISSFYEGSVVHTPKTSRNTPKNTRLFILGITIPCKHPAQHVFPVRRARLLSQYTRTYPVVLRPLAGALVS